MSLYLPVTETRIFAHFELDTMQANIPFLSDRSIPLRLLGIPPFKMLLQFGGQFFVEVVI